MEVENLLPVLPGAGSAPLTGRGRGMPGFAGQGCTPHFLFETSKRKCAVHGGKEKMFGRLNLTPLCQVDRKYGGRRGWCGAVLQACTGCAILWQNRELLPRICGCRLAFVVYLGERRTLGFALVRLILPPSAAVMHLLCSFGVGNPKGRGRSPSPLCRFKGVWGESRNPPTFLEGV